MIKKSNNNGYYVTNFGAIAAARNLTSFDDLFRKKSLLEKKYQQDRESIRKSLDEKYEKLASLREKSRILKKKLTE